MKQKHQHLLAYVLHTRQFRETSLLVEFFTEELGRCSAVARGAYRGKSPTRPILQPFNQLSISLIGNSDLLTMSQVERAGSPIYLEGQALVCGLYLNELLYYTLHRYDPHPGLFHAYHQALTTLLQPPSFLALRPFEFVLLEELGYGVDFSPIQADLCASEKYFRYDLQHGFQVVVGPTDSHSCFSGELLQQIASKAWGAPEVASAAKRLARLALMPILSGKEIHSRELL